MGRFGLFLFLCSLSPALDEADQEIDQADENQHAQHPGEDFLEGVGEFDLGLDVVGLEGLHIDGEFLHFQGLLGAVEHQGVSVHKHGDVRQLVDTAVKGGKEDGGLDVVAGGDFLFLADAGGVQLPLAQDFQRAVFLRFEFGESERRSFRYVLQDDAVAELVCNEHRIPLLEGFQEGISGLFTNALGA